MKGIKLLFVLVLLSVAAIAQQDTLEKKSKREIDILYNWEEIGVNISLNYNHYWQRHAVTLGLKHHFNRMITDNQNFAFKNRGYTTNFKEKLGLNIGYKFDLLKDRETVMPYLFYMTQISYLKFRYNFDYIDTTTVDPTIRVNTIYTEPYLVTQNTLGLGLSIKLFKKWYFNQSAGIGIFTYTSKNIHLSQYKNNWNLSTLLRLGITYKME